MIEYALPRLATIPYSNIDFHKTVVVHSIEYIPNSYDPVDGNSKTFRIICEDPDTGTVGVEETDDIRFVGKEWNSND